jgi:4'-phosphopantetheinyl transferase
MDTLPHDKVPRDQVPQDQVLHNQVHVWYCLTDDPGWVAAELTCLALLSPDEQDRYRRFRFDRDRRPYLFAHTLIRCVLSRYRPVAEADWQFAATAEGKPYLTAPEPHIDLQFSYAHATAIVACAVAQRAPVGVDVEAIDRHVDLQIARLCLSTEERDAFDRLDPNRQHLMLLRHWTLKEAFSKACGQGLGVGFTKYTFLDGDSPHPHISGDPLTPDEAQTWQFELTQLEDRLLLASAAHSPDQQPLTFVTRHLERPAWRDPR